MNMLQRAAAQKLLSPLCGVDRVNHLPLIATAIQKLSSTTPNHPRTPRLLVSQCRTLATDETVLTGSNLPKSKNDLPKSLSSPGFIFRLRNFFGLVPLERHRLSARSHDLYYKLLKSIKYKDFFVKFGMPNTFNSWFLVTELHLWMLMTRAMCEGSGAEEDGRFIRNQLVIIAWKDVDIRLAQLINVNRLAVRRQTKELSGQFHYALIIYDEALLSDDTVLANALWQRFLNADCDDLEKIELLLKYVRISIYNLDKLDRESFINKQNLDWLPSLSAIERSED